MHQFNHNPDTESQRRPLPTEDLEADIVSHENLRTFCVLRLVPLAGMFVGLYLLQYSGVANLRWPFIATLLAAFTLVIALTWLRTYLPAAVRHREFFAYLVIDVAIYSLLMYNTGGASNPFISYFLVPVTIAAIALPAALTWLTGALCLASYSLLLVWHIPLPAVAPDHGLGGAHGGMAINLHVVGMWLNFMVSALLIAYFVNRMARTLARQEQALSRQRQQRLEEEQLLAVATVAASAAHELGTPLNTMRLVCDQWQEEGLPTARDEFQSDAETLGRQIERCQETLKKLSGTARQYSGKGRLRKPVRDFIDHLLEEWLVMRPDINATTHLRTGDPHATIDYHPTLTASIHNLLNNAADASPERVEISGHWDADRAVLEICDYGAGVDADGAASGLAESDKPMGMGLGLFLSRFILSRHRGTVELQPRARGTLTRITLPLRPVADDH